jgi:autotransporter-associated beta strand protein
MEVMTTPIDQLPFFPASAKNKFLVAAMASLVAVVFTHGASAQTGTGLTGRYHDTSTFTTPLTTRTDATVNFNWGTSIPAGTALTAPTTYSIIWSGQIEPAFSELYTFTVTADDGVRLWVDDQMIVGRSFYVAPGELRGQIRLKAGHRVNLRLEFIQGGGSAAVKLEWASASQARQVVPTNRLYPTTEVPNGGSLMREVWTEIPGANISSLISNPNYPNKPASRDFITSFESIARHWEDGFGTRVTGFIRPPVSGNYVFAVSGDEEVQLYLSSDASVANRSLIASVTSPTGVRQWDAQPSQQSISIPLVGGRSYYVELLHKENLAHDHWSVAWKRGSETAFTIIPSTALSMPQVNAVAPATANLFNTLATERPRLGISRERLLWLKQMLQRPDPSAAKSRAQSVINSANNDLTATLATGRHAQDRLQRLALAYWLTEDSRYLDAAWTTIQHVIDNADWSTGDWRPWKGVENGVVAIGFDWLHPFWSPAQRAEMINCMINKGLAGGWTDRYANNIGIIINSGHLMATLAIGTDNESVAESNAMTAIQRLRPKIDKWAVNSGAWYEGTGYGIFTKWNLGQAMPAMEVSLGGTFDLGRSIGIHTTAREPLTISTNTRQRFSFSDVGTPSQAATGWANWWARRYDAPEVYDYSRRIGNSPLNALFIPETTTSPSAAGLNPDTAFIGPVDSPTTNLNANAQDVVTLRENWTDPKATFIGGLGGTYGAHGMLQSGSFQLFASGVNWFVDLSSETYNQPGWITTTPNPNGPDRWDYYRNRAEGHNCLIINPNANPDRIWNAPPAPMISYQSAPNGQRSFAIWDLSRNITGVTRVQRGIQLLGQRKQVLIQDEIVNPTATTCWWFAHFSNSTTATISNDGNSVMLQRGSERLWGRIVNGNGVWTVRAATPLPTSPNPPENTNNSAFRKLAIQLTGVTNTTLAVWFVPLAPGESPPTHTPPVTPLASWNLVAGNEAPIASNGNADSAGGAAVDVPLPAYVTDDWTPSTNMTYAVNTPVGGTVSLLPDGITARFTPTPGFTGLQAFNFTATDADGATSNPATVNFSLPAVIANWTSPGSGNWSNENSWQNGIAPSSSPGNDLQFFSGQTLASGTITATNNLAATTAANKLNFSGTGTATSIVNVDGNPLRLVRNGILSPAITLSGNTTGYRYNISNDIVLDDDVTFHGSGTGTFVFSGAITGSGGITRTGTSSNLILTGNNNYAGSTSINAGTLQVGNDGAIGSLGNGPVNIASGATLRFDRTGTVLVSNDITGAGRVIINGATSSDVASLGGDNDFTGEVRLDSGSLRVTDARQLGSGTKNIIVANSSAVLRIDGSGAPVIFPPDFSVITSNPNGAIINEAGDNEILGNLTLSSGAGNTRLTVASGSLTIHGTVTSNFTSRALELRGAGNGVIHGNLIDGNGANVITGFSKNDAGTWTLNGNNSIASGTVISGGRLVINGSHASGAVSVASGATLAGRGSLTAATTITGTLAPGDNIGTIHFGSTLSFGAASRLQWEIGGNSLVADQAIANGALNVTNGARIDVVLNRPGNTTNFLLSFWRSSRTWPVANASDRTGTFQLGTVTGDSAGHPVATYGSFALQHTTTGVNLVWTPLPGFPIIDEPLVTFLQPTANPTVLPNAESTLRIGATAAGTAPVTYAWTTVSEQEGGQGTVTFGNPAAADTTVSISEIGRYILRCTATNTAVSRSADLIIDIGPPDDGDFSGTVAVIDPGTTPAAAAGFVTQMAGNVSNATTTLWSLVSGPGSVSFSNPASPQTPVVFSAPGNYLLRLTATNSIGQAWRELPVTVSALPDGFETWQSTHWPAITDPNIIGPAADPDGDGATNAAEFLAGTDPKSNTSVPTFVWTQPTTGTWSDAANWSPAAAPASNALTKLEFLTAVTPGGNVTSQHDLGASFTLQRLALNGTGPGTTTLTGGTISFATGGILDLGNGGILYDLATPLELTAPTTVQGSPTAETRFSGGLSGSGSLTKSSSGILEISGTHNLAAAINIHAGTLRVTGPGTSSGPIVARGGSLTVSGGGSIAPTTGAALTLGGAAPGILNYDSSALSRFGAVIVGNGNDGAGVCTLNQSAGTLNASSLTLNSSFTGAGPGDVNLSGGLLAVTGAVTVSNQVAGDNIWSTLTVSGSGSLTAAGGLRLTGAPSAGRNAAGRVTQNGGTVTVSGGLNMARNTATNTSARRGEYHLNGGTLHANQITQDAGTDTFGTFNFNGGTLRPTTNSTTFMQGLTRANVRNNGALIDTGGFDITIAQALLRSNIANDAATDGGLTKSGAGTLTLTAASTYNGPTRITAGTLAHGPSASLATSSITIHPQAVFDVSALPNFALPANRPLTIRINGTGSGSNGRIHAAGLDLTTTSVSFDIATPIDDPVYIIATYTSRTGSAFASATPPAGYTINYAYNGNQIALVSTSGFGGWISGFPSLSDHGPAADPDHDGIPNLMEYILNGAPATPGTAILPTLDASGENFIFTFTRRVESVTDTVQFFDYSSDLTHWNPVDITTLGAPGVTLGSPSAGLQTVTINIPKALAAPGGKLFGRLRAHRAP